MMRDAKDAVDAGMWWSTRPAGTAHWGGAALFFQTWPTHLGECWTHPGGEGRKVDVELPGKTEFKLSWREAGPPNYLDDEVDSDQ